MQTPNKHFNYPSTILRQAQDDIAQDDIAQCDSLFIFKVKRTSVVFARIQVFVVSE